MFDFMRRQRLSADPPSIQPFPTRQMVILALCRICEPIAFMSIFPYIYYMISTFNIASDDRQIAVYAGMVTSAFAFAEFSTGVVWGRLSDVVGRKPILLTGMAGTGISMLVFGFAPNLQTALLARALGGLLNGNIGVIQTTVAEVVQVKEHRPRAYAIMPFVWCLGSIIGSSLGGCLAEPVKNYPAVFGDSALLAKFPFLLPNLICAFIVLCGLVVGILFLEETHEKKKHRRDVGLELGTWLVGKLVGLGRDEIPYSKLDEDANFEDATYFAEDEKSCCSTLTSPRLASLDPGEDPALAPLDPDLKHTEPKLAAVKAFNKQVILCIIAYGILAYHTISFEQLMPVLLSMQGTETPPALPFKFTGGYGLPTSTIGFILSLQGVYQMFAQMILFPMIIKRFGALQTFRFTAITYPFLYFAAPYLTLLPHSLRMPGLFCILVWKVTYQALAYPSNMLVLTNWAPSMLVLGAINGVAASAASLARAFGPTFAGLIESVGLKIGYAGLAWWATSAVAALGALQCLLMRDTQTEHVAQDSASTDLPTDAESRHSNVSDTTLVDEVAHQPQSGHFQHNKAIHEC